MVYQIRGWRQKGKGRALLERHALRHSLYAVVLRTSEILLTVIL